MSRRSARCLALSVFLGVGALMSTNPALAVTFDSGQLQPCFSQKSLNIPPRLQRTTIQLEMHLCEDVTHFTAIFVGDFIDPGKSIALDWAGQFWRGSVELATGRNPDGHREVEASGTALHLVPSRGMTWEFGPLVGGGQGLLPGGSQGPHIPPETSDQEFDVLDHPPESDTFTAKFDVDEGRTLLGVIPPVTNPAGGVPRGWKLTVTGTHGAGPVFFDGPPAPFDVDLVVPQVPLPASVALLFGGLGMMWSVRRPRRRS